ncbi:MAG: hypothetical protein KC505_09155 [Myxococcales bacterium]|nr:hypothetical protein [Myxococcales bacterium]USN51642.1 MAG: hypothetical protein H6731_04320 [Myxococcales bacterium]
MSEVLEKISLFYWGKKQSIAHIEIDAVIKESHELKAKISEHPTEIGESFCDHVQNLPLELSMNGIITNTPNNFLLFPLVKSLDNFISGESNNFAFIAYQKLENIFLKREPISISTSLKDYDNMVLESLSIERGAGTTESLHFRLSAKQIRQINQKLIDLPAPKVERAKPKQRMAKQETKTASEQSQKSLDDLKNKVSDKKSSFLKTLFGFTN